MIPSIFDLIIFDTIWENHTCCAKYFKRAVANMLLFCTRCTPNLVSNKNSRKYNRIPNLVNILCKMAIVYVVIL